MSSKLELCPKCLKGHLRPNSRIRKRSRSI